MSAQIEDTLIEALDYLEQGEPVVKILARYPDMADELRPYLVTAAELNQLATPPSTAGEQASKRQFLQQAAVLGKEYRPAVRSRLRQLLATGASIFLLSLMVGIILVFAAGTAIPGDTLYSTKLFLEEARLSYSADPEAAAALIEAFHQERVDEVSKLISLGRKENVTFSGTVQQHTQQRWVIAGIPVMISADTMIRDQVEVGFLVQVIGWTTEGAVLADQIDIISGQLPDPERNGPLPPSLPSPTPRVEPVNTPASPEMTRPSDEVESTLPPATPDPTVTIEVDMSDDGNVSPEEGGESQEQEKSRDDGEEQEGDDGGSSSEESENPEQGQEDNNTGGESDQQEKDGGSHEEDKGEDSGSEEGSEDTD